MKQVTTRMMHRSVRALDGTETCLRCGAKRDKKNGIKVKDPSSRLYPGVLSPITHGWVLQDGKVQSECDGTP